MTAPKIDTQAPERLRAFAHETKTTLNGVSDQIADDIIALLDLSAAREAAAAQAMREAAAKEATTPDYVLPSACTCAYARDRLNTCIHHLMQNTGIAIRALPLPDTTALDRLIAERVREAFAALDECLDWMEQLRASGDAGFWEWQPGDAYNKGMALIARGSKEGQS